MPPLDWVLVAVGRGAVVVCGPTVGLGPEVAVSRAVAGIVVWTVLAVSSFLRAVR